MGGIRRRDGVPYFVHSVTGVSQWGAPDELEDGEDNQGKKQNLDDGDTWDTHLDDHGQDTLSTMSRRNRDGR